MLLQNTQAVITLPRKFTFHRGVIDFDYILQFFDWDIHDAPVQIDLTQCESANYQALVLLIQYVWHLTIKGCNVTFRYGLSSSGPTSMLTKMGALDWQQILANNGQDFGPHQGSTFALRRRSDVQNAINIARRAIQGYKIGFPEYLSYIISELLYNATEHGRRTAPLGGTDTIVPSIFQYGNYPTLNRLSFIFSDLGIGIKSHLEQTYPSFPSHTEAIRYALRPNVSGTFVQHSDPYAAKNNAGMGLTYSSLMLKRLNGDMYIVSHNGLVHVSHADVTVRNIQFSWPGTFVLVNLNLKAAPALRLEDLMAEIRASAQNEISNSNQREESNRYVVSIYNYFGKWAEDKDAVIVFRDRHLIPALDAGKKIELDFQSVETAPHSFLNALLASAVQRLGVYAYQRIKIINAPGPVREIIDMIFEENIPQLS